MTIVCSTNDSYAQHLTVMLLSMFANNPQAEVHIFFERLSNENVQKIRRSIGTFSQQTFFTKLDLPNEYAYPLKHHFSKEMYIRILIPEIIEAKEKKILYLDADIVVNGSLEKLWRINLEENIVAAVENKGFNRHELIKIPTGYPYFNSGVLLIDLAKWRMEKITEKVMRFIQENEKTIEFGDQDSLNAILFNSWKKIHFQYNFTSPDTYLHKSTTPLIVHFTGSTKPWHFASNHKYKYLYWKWLMQTEYRQFRPADIGLLSLVKRLIPLHKQAILYRSWRSLQSRAQ